VLITPSLGVPNWSVIYINTAPSQPSMDNSTAKQEAQPQLLESNPKKTAQNQKRRNFESKHQT
jgi:hypothetical protein